MAEQILTLNFEEAGGKNRENETSVLLRGE